MKLIKSMLCSGLIFASCGANADLAEPFASIYPLAETSYTFDNAYILINQINTQNATVFIDVGSQNGAASRVVAQYVPTVKIYNVNMWQSCDSCQKYAYQRFLSNLIAEKTTGQIIPVRMTSLEAAKALNVTAGVIYLDNCDQSVSAEILAWASHLTSNGVICGRDWTDAQVQFSVAQAANKLGFLVKSNGDYWFVEKN